MVDRKDKYQSYNEILIDLTELMYVKADIAKNNLENYPSVTAARIQAQVFNFAEELQGDYFTEAPFKGSTAVRNACSYLNSGIYAEAKKGYVTDEFIDKAFTDAYNNAVNG